MWTANVLFGTSNGKENSWFVSPQFEMGLLSQERLYSQYDVQELSANKNI
jgi:hypothetical protein